MDCRLCLLLALLVILGGCDIVTAPTATNPASSPVAAPPTPTAEVVPPPAVLLERAHAARAIGADAAAGDALSLLLQTYPDAPEVREATYFLAESFARRGRWTSAATLWQPLAAEPPEDALAVAARFWQALAHEAAGDHAAAAAAYAAFRELNTPLAPYAALRQGDQLRALGRNAEAADAYLAAAQSDIARIERAAAYERATVAQRAADQIDAALLSFTELIDLAEQPAYRARIMGEAIAIADAAGRADQAAAWRRSLVVQAPATAQAADAAAVLLQAGDPAVSPATAGQIFFTAERWPEAISALDQALPQVSDAETGAELQRLRGLALRAQGDFAGALTALAEAGALNPNGSSGRQAQLDWIQTLGQSGATDQAIQAYQEFAAAYPDDERAPEALNRAIILLERIADTAGAAAVRAGLGERYPASSQGRAALHRLGLERFQTGDYPAAQAFWQRLADQNSGNWAAQGAFWAGRAAQAQGAAAAADTLFAAARTAGPTSYYGVRAAEILSAEPEGVLPLRAPFTPDDWAELNAWVATWHTSADTTDPAIGAALERAVLLEQVSLTISARNERQAALDAAATDPFALALVAESAAAAAATPISLSAAEALTALAPATASPPPIVQRLLYPVPFPDLVLRESAAHNLDPRLFLALLRQESRFDPGATSWVGARGIAQVMPATGEGIARDLGVTDFTVDDLYRPGVSVRFGTYYLGRRLSDMEGSQAGALAAYNGGLGNAMRWAGGTQVTDPDLFAEIIDFPETQGYVKVVLANYGMYRALYAAP